VFVTSAFIVTVPSCGILEGSITQAETELEMRVGAAVHIVLPDGGFPAGRLAVVINGVILDSSAFTFFQIVAGLCWDIFIFLTWFLFRLVLAVLIGSLSDADARVHSLY
jgi:hypothetical protein